jgi:hypothetical protein
MGMGLDGWMVVDDAGLGYLYDGISRRAGYDQDVMCERRVSKRKSELLLDVITFTSNL